MGAPAPADLPGHIPTPCSSVHAPPHSPRSSCADPTKLGPVLGSLSGLLATRPTGHLRRGLPPPHPCKSRPQASFPPCTLCYTVLCYPKCSVCPSRLRTAGGQGLGFLVHWHSAHTSGSQSMVLGTPGVGSWGHFRAPHCSLCLSAELISSFLLITMLFIISLSLLIGVVKVSAWSGRGRGARICGLARRPSCPPGSLLFTPTVWTALDAGRWEVGIWRRSKLHPRNLHTYFLETPLFTPDPSGWRPQFPVKIHPPRTRVCTAGCGHC